MTINQVAHSDALPDSFLCPLPYMGVIQVSGEDQTQYLQGQLTNDLAGLHANQGLLACHCDFKGKSWNIPWVVKSEQVTLLVSHQQAIENSLKELQKFGVFSNVDIQETSAEYQIFGGQGTALESAIEDYFSDVPFEHMQSFSNDKGWVICLTSPNPRYLLLLKADVAEQFVTDTKTELFDSSLWQYLDIKAGRSHIQAHTSGEFVPQMMNMHALNAINFTKGCYTGQEVVARTKYLGKNKRATFILSGELASGLEAGDILEMQLGENWRRAGTVLNVAHLQQQSWLLAVLPNDLAASTQLRAKQDTDKLFSIQPLPYNLED